MRDLLARLHAALSTRPVNLIGRVDATRPARIEAKGDDATVWIYDVIGDWGVSAAELGPQLEELKAQQITVRLNSPGGDYFDGVAIANALARHPATVTVHVDGLAASAASVIAMAGDRVVMHPGAQMMIHDALTMTIGNAAAHDKTRALLDSASQDIASLYASRAGGGAAEWRDLMRAETWYTATEAVAAGLAHEAPTPEPSDTDHPTWAQALAAFRDVSRETSPQTPDAASPTPGAPLPTLSELVRSALNERTVA
jgi:ATP-dependent protease ClpP protease subunit